MDALSDRDLAAALGTTRVAGAIFLRAEYTEGWAYASPPPADLAGMLSPGAERLVLFHIVAEGACWVAVGDGERHWARRGDVIVLPFGDEHAMGGRTPAERVPIADLLDPQPWNRLPVIRHGDGGPRTEVVCGYLVADDPLFDPAVRALPPVFVVTPTGAAADWVRSSIAYALEAAQPDAPGGGVAASRLPELVLAEVLRIHLASAPAVDHGWLAALRDPVVGPAVARLHAEPARRWTVADLAAATAVSRSLLDERFRQVLALSPIRYLTDWRMHLAQELLATSDLGVGAVARRVGYGAEEAFSRAFKRRFGRSPAAWRAGRTASPA